jgi:hypothetical protein
LDVLDLAGHVGVAALDREVCQHVVEPFLVVYYATVILPDERRDAIRAVILAHVTQIEAAATGEIKHARATEVRLAREERKLLDAHYADREVVPFAVEVRGGDPVSERLRA